MIDDDDSQRKQSKINNNKSARKCVRFDLIRLKHQIKQTEMFSVEKK